MNAVAIDAQLLDEIKSILRRDLKLGSNARIDDDMPLIGGELDLDSLDILLVISSIEKHFRIKIPNEVVGRWAFQNVSTLTRFVQDNRNASASERPGVSGAQSPNWLDRLPHGAEFRFVSTVSDVSPEKHARAIWHVDGSEWFFKAHFPGNPIVPGVLLIEALAQTAGLAAASTTDRHGSLAHADVKFERPVAPPANIELSANITRTMGQLRMCEVAATINGQVVARGTVAIKLS